MKELLGLEVSNAIKIDIENRLKDLNKTPTLAIIRVGENPADISYEKAATKKLLSFSLDVKNFIFSENISFDEFKKEFKKINEDNNIDGILLLRPLPSHINEDEISALINPKKI